MTRIEWHGPEFVRAVEESADLGVGAAADVVKREAKRSMGRGMQKGGPPAPPGSPPNIQTGNLRRNVVVSRKARYRWLVGARPITGNVGSGVDYGFYLEFGTSKMAPRPWLRPALRWAQNTGRIYHKFDERFRKELATRYLRKAGVS